MPAKTPMYLKTPTPKIGKKIKLRDVLSSDMISPPLGDVRHSAHVGPEGENDMFGDVSFLQGKVDMLPVSAHPSHLSSNNMNRHADDMFEVKGRQHRHDPRNNSNHNSILKNTISMPAFIAPEQPPPKPPRLHLEESSKQQKNHHNQQQHSMPVCTEGVGHYMELYHDFTLIPILRHLVPSAGSFSEGSSDESISESCTPPDPKRGLSLDSDAGLSNEDLRSEHSESSTFSPTMSRSESFAGLDLDLGPSILEDVLRIMDRYKSAKQV